MIDIDKLDLRSKLKLYAYGDDELGYAPHGFDFAEQDIKAMLKALDDADKLRALADNVSCIVEIAENIRNGGRIE